MRYPHLPQLAFLLLSSLPFSAIATDVNPSKEKGKTVENPVEFKSTKEYEDEAKVRISGFTLPEDVKASLFADSSQTQNPSAICFDRNGKMYVAEIHRWRAGVQDIRNEQQILLDDINNRTSEDRLEMYQRDALTRPLSFYSEFEDRIVVIDDTDNDGRADNNSVWADGFNDPLDGPGIGLVAGPDNEIYYTNIPHVWKLADTDKDGKADEQTSLQDGFGVRMSISGHDMHGIIWGPDGKLYWSIGDRGYHFTTKEGRHYDRNYEGAVFRCDPDGSNVEEIYRGLRNPQELAFDKYGNLFTCDNDADQWDTGRLVYILEGGNAGWNHGHQVILNFRNQLELRTPDYEHPGHKTIPMSPWMAEGIWEPLHDERPAFTLPPIDKVSWGPSGFVYNYGVTAMPERYADHFWICNFGGANGDLEAFTVKENGAGFSLDQHEKFMVGLGNTDVEFGPDGRMYLSCFNNNGWYKQDIGNIYALETKEPKNRDLLVETEKLLTTDLSTLVESEAAVLLGHPDMRVRMFAQFDLVRRGSTQVFLDSIAQNENQLKRLHGIWGLGQLAGKDEALLSHHIELLTDKDAEVRAQAAKVLADSRTTAAGEALVAALDDESARVQSFAAIGVGKCGNALALDKLLEMLAGNDNQDVFLRHALVQGLWGLNQREKILKQTKNESAAVRLGVLLALRKLEDPRVKFFLGDEDKFIRDEAIRAINDLDLYTALPALAEQITPFIEAGEGTAFPEGHRDLLTHTRIINANFRVGEPENASHLLAYAAGTKLPMVLREQALKAILEWKEPNPVDSTNGFYRPLDPAKRPDISEAVRSGLPAVFDTAEGNLISLATRIALEYGAEAPVELLTKQITDEEAELEARIGSLQGLARQDIAALESLWDSLLESGAPRFKAAVVEQLVRADKDRAVFEAISMAESGDLRTRQQGYRLLSGIDSIAAIEFFRQGLEALKKEKPGALLDLLEGASAKRSDEKVAALLDAYEGSLDPDDPTAAFHPALKGGDVKAGKEIFMTHAAGQCAKCHKVNGDGGVAGPELTGIGSRQDHAYLLASLVAPSSVIVPGYGMTMVTLKTGESIGGALLEETDQAVTLKLPDPEDPDRQIEKTIPLAEIETRQPPISAMPPMGYILKKAEIRDLVAYLASLKEKNGKKGH
ncbi:MAG: HEAT repeat domain-containing protein [Verrucomicrobiales bacterium]|nr:HEAT repeat domain-containing protein [Verrucomicrobiales bacterium]